MKIEIVSTDSILPDPRNARLHSQKQLEEIAASLKRFGQQKPIVVSSDNIIIAGNGQFQAATKILKWKKIVIARSLLTKEEAVAYAIADNQIGLNSDWDMELLSTQIKELNSWNPQQNWESLGIDADMANLVISGVSAVGEEESEVDKEQKLDTLFTDDEETSKKEDPLEKQKFGLPFKVTTEQRETIETAINLLRYYQNDPKITEGRALELICADWSLNDLSQLKEGA